MHAADPKKFPTATKADARILNASEQTHYKALTGRTEAKSTDNLSPSNLARVSKQLEGQDVAVALGRKAAEAVRASGFEGRVVEHPHPSMQNINRNYKSDAATPEARAKDRLNQYTNDLIKKSKI